MHREKKAFVCLQSLPQLLFPPLKSFPTILAPPHQGSRVLIHFSITGVTQRLKVTRISREGTGEVTRVVALRATHV